MGSTLSIDDCRLICHPSDTDSDKITGRVSSIITDVTTECLPDRVETDARNICPIKLTKLCHTSTTEEKDETRRMWNSDRKVSAIFILTEGIAQEAHGFLNEMTEAATQSETVKILTVFYKVTQDKIPQKLKDHVTLDYEVQDFKDRLVSIVQEWATGPQDPGSGNAAVSTGATNSTTGVDTVISNVIFDMIKKKEYTPYDLYQKLVAFSGKTNLRLLHSEDGLNPLHAIIIYNRLPLMMTLVQCKVFTAYLHETVPISSSSTFRGHTAHQITQSKKARRFKDTLVQHEQLVNSMTKFLKACHDGDVALVRRSVESQRQVVHERDTMKNNCLYWAVVSNNLEVFKMLLEYGADCNNVNDNKETLLHVACMLGHHKFIDILLTRCKLDVSAACSNKRTPLERVAENGDIDCLKELLKHKVSLTACVLPYAAANGRLSFIKYVLEETTQHVHVDNRDNTGRSAFMKACETGRKELVDYLLAKDASVNVEDLRHRTPLHVACENGHVDIVKLLLNKEARLEVQDCYTGAELCFLIRGKDKGRKAWHYVEVRRNVVVIFLQKTRAGQVDVAVYGTVVKSGWGEDPPKATIEWVEKMFSDRRSTQTPDLTPLHMAIYKEHPEVAALLIQKGADINSKDHFGITPFMMCALRNDVATATMLEERGVNVHEKDREGHTALEIAEMNEQTEMVNYIKGQSCYLHSERRLCLQKYLTDHLYQVLETLQKAHMEGLRQQGTDVRRHIIDTVRDLTNANNILLKDLGSGPIMKASSGESNATTIPSFQSADSGYGSSGISTMGLSNMSAELSSPVRATDSSTSAQAVTA